jgi:hypothetical protein
VRAPLLALALLLVMAAPAYAGSADSNITLPSGTTFLVDDGGGTLLVSGTADFNNIDIVCTYGPDDTRVPISATDYPQYYNFPLDAGNHFSRDLPLKPLEYEDCVLHAVPAGSTDPDLSTLMGPTLSVAYRHAAAGPFDYDLELAPLGGSVEFGQSSASGGIETTYALNAADLSYVELFSGADSLASPPAVDSGREAVQVDGQDAYFQNDVNGIADSGPDVPAPTLNFDPSDGTGSVSSHEPLGACVPGGTFPPNHASCHDVAADGVRLDHSGNVIDDGALGMVDEQFTSTDGAAHTVDLWLRQQASNVTGVQWQFPGDPGFSDYAGVVGKTVPGGPVTALLNEPGPAYGSLSWSDAPDGVRFTNRGAFFMHYHFTVPAGGSHVLHFAYGSSFTPGGAAALGTEALTTWQPPAPPATQPVVTPPAGGGGGSAARLKFSAKPKGDGSVTVTFSAPGAGSLSGTETAVVPVSAKKKTKKLTVASARRKVTRAGAVKLVLKLNRKGRKIFRAKHRLPVTLTLAFKPSVGTATKLAPKHLTLKLKKQKRRRH